ncbi:SDR family NAD(P)-dependent oxidoreductase [Streptomyces sp. NBC_01613]|uniref:SDR family NAD(P)-dependent oxidoreductase n=1 Tax=Streptomyces sp. NBC_01613 TaxID=2975896 RepID=UPI003867CAA8
MAQALASIESEVGAIDVLVNNAGVQHREPLVEVSLDNWQRVLETNLTGAFVVSRHVARRMLPRRSGKIINICSVQTDLARPAIGPYTAAKGALRNLTRAMTWEWAGAGLQINGIASGYIHTPSPSMTPWRPWPSPRTRRSRARSSSASEDTLRLRHPAPP